MMAAEEDEVWKPGSFTKNFSWGDKAGLLQLHESIRIGFNNRLENTKRDNFRRRVSKLNRPDYIPMNFFLFNKKVGDTDYLVADELVFQAVTAPHSPRFDKLALFAFNFSYVGRWSGSSPSQRRPALWAFHYIRDRVATEFDWSTKRVTANDIEKFVGGDSRYQAQDARKLSTNLNHLYKVGRLTELKEQRVERWWVDAVFLALDRLLEDRRLNGLRTEISDYSGILTASGFLDVAGKRSLEKELAANHLVRLYAACGARKRFSEEHVRERTELKVGDLSRFAEFNTDDPPGALHPTNPRILKSIPRACAMLARYAGFQVISALMMEEFDADEFVRTRTREALKALKERGVTPTMSAEDVLKLTRGE